MHYFTLVMIWKQLHKIIAILFFGLCNLTAQTQSPSQEKIEKILQRKVFKPTSVSITAIDIEADTQVVNYRGDKVLIPASSLKLITTLTAIDKLGDEFRYTTKITHDGHIHQDGTLKGNIYIEGSGDPTLGSSRFESVLDFKDLIKHISKQIIDFGITCVEGDIIADESIFDSFPVSPSWQWNDLGNYYASGAWGINVNENLYHLYFHKRNVIGSQPAIKFYTPDIPNLEFSNELKVDSAHTGDNAYIFGGPYTYKKRVSGTIPQGKTTFSIKGSLPDPPLFLAYHIAKQLKKENINTQGHSTLFRNSKKKKQRKKILELVSPPLQKIVELANEKSINIYCESLMKTIAKESKMRGAGGEGILSMERLLKKAGVSITGLHMEDGSGLSARNNVCSRVLAETVAAYFKKFGESRMKVYLPRTGEGTVVNMFSGTSLAGKVWLKSGSMEKVYSYTGFLKNKKGKWISFSVIANGFSVKHSTMRPQLEKLITQIYLYS